MFLLRISKTQVAKVLRKELAKEEFPIGFEQCSHDLTCLCNLCVLSHTSPDCNLHFLNNVTYMSVEVISGMLAPPIMGVGILLKFMLSRVRSHIRVFVLLLPGRFYIGWWPFCDAKVERQEP